MTLSRRRLIHLVGKAGGAAAAYRTMAAMGWLPVPEAYAGPPELPRGDGKGEPILILGAGIAGMVAAYELKRAGYPCRILEARHRPGGRNWSLRAGDTVEETDSRQRVLWDAAPHLYVNPGPARLPYHHRGILGYCRALGVPLEVMCNDDRAALLQDDKAFAGKPQRQRAVINDERGYVAELAAKAVDQARLGEPVSPEDKERLRDFLRAFGALDKDLVYRGSPRAGYRVTPGAGERAGTLAEPLDLRAILQSSFWQYDTQFGETFDQAATMMEPVGGMGAIGRAFGRALGDTITYDAEVTRLERRGEGARVLWRDRKSGARHQTDARHVICTIPFPALAGIEADFAPETRAAMKAADYVPAAKVAFQAERRFWEQDDAIYGGISWTSRASTQVWYPTAGLQQQKGILLGAYIWSDDIGNAFARKPLPQRLSDTLDDCERLHPGCRADLRLGVSIAWSKIPFTRGAWAEWPEEARQGAYRTLLKGDGPFRFCGEHMSYVNGWQEGAVLSAHDVIAEIAREIAARRATQRE
jgi:monoamine oxidase